jgi:hypothetical protein
MKNSPKTQQKAWDWPSRPSWGHFFRPEKCSPCPISAHCVYARQMPGTRIGVRI